MVLLVQVLYSMFDVGRFPLQAGFDVHLFSRLFNDQTGCLSGQEQRSCAEN